MCLSRLLPRGGGGGGGVGIGEYSKKGFVRRCFAPRSKFLSLLPFYKAYSGTLRRLKSPKMALICLKTPDFRDTFCLSRLKSLKVDLKLRRLKDPE